MLTRFTQMLLRSLGALVLVAAASSVASTMAQSSIVLMSGGEIGGRDAANQFTLDKGNTWQDAYVVPKDWRWDIIFGTQFISVTPNAQGFPHQTVRYRTTFTLPAGFTDASFLISIHADNAATIWLNGNQIGQQVQAEDPINFRDPAEKYKTAEAKHFKAGVNELVFDITNFRDPSGFDYFAVVNYKLKVDIDIKPGEFPNTINLGSNGNVPVAILSSATFDATQVDPLTVTLAGAHVAIRGRGTPMAEVTDVNGDGLLDLLVHVETEALELSPDDTEAILLGQTYGGLYITGTDSVRIVP